MEKNVVSLLILSSMKKKHSYEFAKRKKNRKKGKNRRQRSNHGHLSMLQTSFGTLHHFSLDCSKECCYKRET